MTAQQHKYTVAATVTENVARVGRITLLPQDEAVEVEYEIGEETGGVFTQTDRKVVRIEYAAIDPSPTLTTLQDLESKALTYGAAQGLYPAGAQENVP